MIRAPNLPERPARPRSRHMHRMGNTELFSADVAAMLDELDEMTETERIALAWHEPRH